MKILITSSQSENIDEKYKESARKLCSFLAEEENILVWGSGSKSLMGISYEEFAKRNRKIEGFTTKKYIDLIEFLPKANHMVLEDTFELKKALFNEAELIVVLPGGIGTISELFAYIEEMRSNGVSKKIIIFDEYGYYNKTLELIEDLINKKFSDNSINDYIQVVDNLDRFKDLYNKLK